MPKRRRRDELDEALELMHVAFRHLVSEPDRLLADAGLNRSHHRILHVIVRNPGLTISDLLDTLIISRQALHRPLRALIDRGLVRAAPDPDNRRLVRLRVTRAGAGLVQRLSGHQRRIMAAAFKASGPKAERAWRAVMTRLASGAPAIDSPGGLANAPRRRRPAR